MKFVTTMMFFLYLQQASAFLFGKGGLSGALGGLGGGGGKSSSNSETYYAVPGPGFSGKNSETYYAQPLVTYSAPSQRKPKVQTYKIIVKNAPKSNHHVQTFKIIHIDKGNSVGGGSKGWH